MGRNGKWNAIVAIALAQFVMVLDTTVMNVSLEVVVDDLDTTIANLQLAITFFTLTMAALMLTGGKLGGIWGRLRTYRIGAVVYGVGSMITALAPNIGVLIVGWSFIEAMGAALIIPATVALTARNYKGRDRAIAYGILGGIGAAGAAAGPLIGGLVTEYASWRYVFAAETVVMVGLLATSRVIKDSPADDDARLDLPSVVLSALGLGLIVYGVLRASVWGWFVPSGSGPELLGISLVPYLVAAGILTLGVFVRRQESLERRGKVPLVPAKLLRIPQLRGGLVMLVALQLLLAGTFFILPVYLQIVLGNGPLDTGTRILPLAVGVIVFSLLGARASGLYSPRAIVRVGLVLVFAGILTILGAVDEMLQSGLFLLGMAVFGAGVGLGISQLGNTVMSSAPQKSASEAGGLQGTAQNLGMSLGTALIGAVLLSSLTTAIQTTIESDQRIPKDVQQQVANSTEQAPVITEEEAKAELARTSLTPSEQKAALEDYSSSLLTGLKAALAAAALLALLAIGFVRVLPTKPLVPAKPKKGRAPPGRRSRLRASMLIVVAATAALASWSAAPAEAASCRVAPQAKRCPLEFAARKAGMAIGASIAEGIPARQRADILAHFNSVSDENAFKWASMQPTEGPADYSDTDALVNWANAQELRLRGHVLFWHRLQTPGWVRSSVEGAADPQARLRALMTNRIQQVLGRYRGKVDVYDVVNEPLQVFGPGWDTTDSLLSAKNFFHTTLGEGYIDHAFREARRVDPKAKLALNETVWNPIIGDDKADAFLALVRRLKQRGVPIDEVGLQTHGMFGVDPPFFPGSTASFRRYIDALGRLGVKVEITELDVSLPRLASTPDPLAAQAERYRRVVLACAQSRHCVGVTTWNIRDDETWLDTYWATAALAPNEPLLLDAAGRPKPAYGAVRSALLARCRQPWVKKTKRGKASARKRSPKPCVKAWP